MRHGAFRPVPMVRKCRRREERPPWLKNRHDRIALVSRDRHVALLDHDDETPIGARDSFPWRRSLDRQRHYIFPMN